MRFLLVLLALCLPLASHAASRTEELKRCFATFGDIEWKLPYQPTLRIQRCAPGSLDLIGDLTLGGAPLSSDDHYAALQRIVLTHFDSLFRRHGFHQVATEMDNARTERRMAKQCRLHGANCNQAELPPIPYIKMARYMRGSQVLVFTTEGRNTWRIKLEGAK